MTSKDQDAPIYAAVVGNANESKDTEINTEESVSPPCKLTCFLTDICNIA